MEAQSTGLKFDEFGIAQAIQKGPLSVPLNQREYRWTDQVEQLFADISKAYDDNEKIYFLGMIVLTHNPRGQIEIADGQQRLATVSILIAAVRDYLIELGDQPAADKYQTDYLLEYDPPTKEFRPKLHLNYQDHHFFLETILRRPSERKAFEGRHFHSHDRLAKAAELSRRYVRDISAQHRKDSAKADRLYKLVDYLRDCVRAIVITVPGYIGNAFKMFATLNGRGLPASQVDLLKNFLFELARERIEEVHPMWISMQSTIEAQGDDDLQLTYIRHFWITQNGPTTEDEIGDSVEKAVRGERRAVETVSKLDSAATRYVSLLTPRDHPSLDRLGRQGRDCLYTITKELGIEQIRPLLLAILSGEWNPREAEKAFEKCLSWSVRFLIVGGGGGGLLDRHYGLRAQEITKGEIKDAKTLATKMEPHVPPDSVFKGEFATASARRANLARYYLRSIELYLKRDPKPQFVPSDDTTHVNLEHVLPVNPSSDWHISADVAAGYYRRLGNMALLGAKDNVEIGNASFADKKLVFKGSPFETTKSIAKCRTWGPEEIENRQKELAEYVVKIWPL